MNSRDPLEVTLWIPVDDGGTGGFDYTVCVLYHFNNTFDSTSVTFSVDQKISLYQNQSEDMYSVGNYWDGTIHEARHLKNDAGNWKDNVFDKFKFHNYFFNLLASLGFAFATSDVILFHIEDPQEISNDAPDIDFLVCFNCQWSAKCLMNEQERSLKDEKIKGLFFHLFPNPTMTIMSAYIYSIFQWGIVWDHWRLFPRSIPPQSLSHLAYWWYSKRSWWQNYLTMTTASVNQMTPTQMTFTMPLSIIQLAASILPAIIHILVMMDLQHHMHQKFATHLDKTYLLVLLNETLKGFQVEISLSTWHKRNCTLYPMDQ